MIILKLLTLGKSHLAHRHSIIAHLEAIKAASSFKHLVSHNCDSIAIYLIPVSQ